MYARTFLACLSYSPIHFDTFKQSDWNKDSRNVTPCFNFPSFKNSQKTCYYFSSKTYHQYHEIERHKPLSLRKLAQPFLLSYHPDRLASSTEVVRTTNLSAVQTLNGFIDNIESIYDRAWKHSTQHNGRLELLPNYSVEFIITKSKNSSSRLKSSDASSYYTRRSIDILFSEHERMSIQAVDKEGRFSIQAATLIQNKARREIRKLLNLAGLEHPPGAHFDDDIEEISKTSGLEDHLLHEELDLDKPSYKAYESSRREFMKNIDWNKHRRMYDDALEDMKRDLYTQGLIGGHEDRKEIFISHVLSRVRVESPTITKFTSTTLNSYHTIDPMEQLIAIRRMAVLLMDNFDTLEIEEMGRMWERLVFILLPPLNSPYCKLQQDGSLEKTQNITGTRKSKRNSGFKFTVYSDNSVSINLPVNFSDETFLDEMKANLADFFDLCVRDDDLYQYFPPYYKEWIKESRNKFQRN